MKWLKSLFTDNRRIGIVRGSYEQGGLLGKMQGYPIKRFSATVRLNEIKGDFANVDIESTQNISLDMFKRDIISDGSWIEMKEITWLT